MNKEDGKAGNNRSVFDVLSNVSGLSKDTIYDIAKKVKENQARLEACKYHNFQLTEKQGRYKCTNCNGEVDSINKSWYELGIEHGRKQEE